MWWWERKACSAGAAALAVQQGPALVTVDVCGGGVVGWGIEGFGQSRIANR
jgi:hypothetical protein